MNRKQILDKIQEIKDTCFDASGYFMNIHDKIKQISELKAQLKEIDNA